MSTNPTSTTKATTDATGDRDAVWKSLLDLSRTRAEQTGQTREQAFVSVIGTPEGRDLVARCQAADPGVQKAAESQNARCNVARIFDATARVRFPSLTPEAASTKLLSTAEGAALYAAYQTI